jgi:hypothetical protein
MLLLLQINGFETMVLSLSNKFDLETHQKVNICTFIYKFVFCTRWAQFLIFHLLFIHFLVLDKQGEVNLGHCCG